MARKRKRRHKQRLGTVASFDSPLLATHAVSEAIPARWHDRARKAWEYYVEEPIVSNAINSWRVFALGDEIRITCEDEQVEAKAQEVFYDLEVERFVKDMILQLLVKGDAIGHMRRGKDGGIEKLTCVNPVSVELEYHDGELVRAVQRVEGQGGVVGEEIELDPSELLHLKWNAPEFSPRGNSMVLPAFESIELLRDYRKTERAIAKRWTAPLRFIQVGGHFGNKTIMPDERMLEYIRRELNNMTMGSGLVVPFYVKAETYGTEGKALDTESKVQGIKEDILVALGMARSLVTGDGPNFATASVSMHKMVVQLKEIKQAARKVLDWVFDAWLESQGYEAELVYHFDDLDLHDEADAKKLLLEMYDRGLISKKTLQTKMGLDPAAEESAREDEEIVLDRNWSVQDIVQLVSLDILTPQEARRMLGLDGEAEEEPGANDVDAMYGKRERWPGKGSR